MTVNTIMIVINSSVHTLVTAMYVKYTTNSLIFYFNFQVTSELSKTKLLASM